MHTLTDAARGTRYGVTGLLCVLLVLGCGEADAPTAHRTAVQVATVSNEQGLAGQRYSADLRPATRVDLAFRVGGYVQSVAQVTDVAGKKRLLQEGDPVRSGMELASLRTADFSQKVSEAQAALAQARASAELARQTFERTQRLAGGGSVAPAQLDAARSQRDAARGALQGAQARLEEARTALADAQLRSPLDGVVLQRNVEVGTLAAPGTLAFVVADTARVSVVFGVPDTVVQSVQLGAVQPVTLQALPGQQLEGRISRIAPAADPKGRLFEVEVVLPNPDGRLKPGMVASLVLRTQAAQQAQSQPLVPISAIVRSPRPQGGFAVFVVAQAPQGQPPVARLRDVELGEFMGTSIPVVKGLASGERIVVTGASLLSDGEAVEVLP